MKTPEELRAAATRYRQLARSVTDQFALDALLELADEYEKLAVQDGHIDKRIDIKTNHDG
jgi:hypothetical protein